MSPVAVSVAGTRSTKSGESGSTRGTVSPMPSPGIGTNKS